MVALFMRNIKWFRNVVVFIILFFATDYCIFHILANVYGGYTKTAIDEMYGQVKNIDLVFTGASHTYQSFNPLIFDRALKVNSFNAGSSAQRVIDTYYYLNEILKHNQLKMVVFEVTYNQYNRYDFNSNPVPFFLVSDYLKPSIENLPYMLNGLASNYWAYSLVKTSRFNGKVDFLTVSDIIAGVKTYTLNESRTYISKGFVAVNTGYSNGNMGMIHTFQWSNENLYPQSFKYFDKVMKLCKKNNIKVVLVTAPIPIPSMISIGNYEEVNTFFTDLAKKYKLDYFDFNLVRPEIFKRPDSFFEDDTHLNGKGANEFSKMFAAFLQDYNNNGVDREHYLYSSFNDLWSDIDSVLAVGIEQNNNVITAQSIQGKNVIPEYEFLTIDTLGNIKKIRDYSPKNTVVLSLPENDSLKIRVNSRAVGSNAQYQAYWEINIK
jgi:hypothetical protein